MSYTSVYRWKWWLSLKIFPQKTCSELAYNSNNTMTPNNAYRVLTSTKTYKNFFPRMKWMNKFFSSSYQITVKVPFMVATPHKYHNEMTVWLQKNTLWTPRCSRKWSTWKTFHSSTHPLLKWPQTLYPLLAKFTLQPIRKSLCFQNVTLINTHQSETIFSLDKLTAF